MLDTYLISNPTTRSLLRDSIRKFPLVHASLFEFGEEFYWLARRNGGRVLLTKLVGLISLDDSGSGSGGCWNFLLSDLYVSAEQFGWNQTEIDHVLGQIALISNSAVSDSGGDESTSTFLSEYSP